jgi:hypothetical protein
VGILADVQQDDQHTLEAHAGQPLAESRYAVGVMAFQVAQTFDWVYTLR